MAMSKKHYVAVAKALAANAPVAGPNEVNACHQYACIVDDLARVFAQDNPRFDAARFKAAAGVQEVAL